MTSLAAVGCGAWGRNNVRAIRQIGALGAIVDSDPVRLKDLSRAHPGVAAHSNLADLLRTTACEGVVIATPASTHAQLCREALEADRDVLVEKPLALSEEDAVTLCDLAAKRNRVLMVGHLLLYHPAVRYIKHLIGTGDIGDPLYLYTQRVNLGQLRCDENALWSLAPHDISIALHLFEALPIRIGCIGSSYIRAGVEDVIFLTLHFADGRMAHIHVSWLDPHKIRKLTLVGRRKMVVFDDMEAIEKVRIFDKGVGQPREYETYGEALTLRTGDILIPSVTMVEPLTLQIQHFLDCVARRSTPLSDGRSGLDVVKILTAAQRSLRANGMPEPFHA